MDTLLAVIVVAMFSHSNAQFIERSNEQIAQGYKWTYVGKQAPSGDPAITIKPEHADEFILFKLAK
jgi:hypothetical protein|tara:strand:- start:1376 stop:1573 length:198 start_codon:yes stop_codon:yes gene_type:complete